MALPINTIIQRLCAGLYADAGLSDFITMATERTDAVWWGGAYNMAVALRACHDWTLATTRPLGTPGAATSLSEGGQSQSFSASGGSVPGDLEQTVFGMRLKGLRRSRPAAGVVTGLPQPVISGDMRNWANW